MGTRRVDTNHLWQACNLYPANGLVLYQLVPANAITTTGKMKIPTSLESSTYIGSTKTLNQQGRPMFDPFRRGQRVYFDLDEETYETTLGQLYFWWAYKYKVLNKLADPDRIQLVEQHMSRQHELAKARKATGKRKDSPCQRHPQCPARFTRYPASIDLTILILRTIDRRHHNRLPMQRSVFPHRLFLFFQGRSLNRTS